MVLVLPDKLLSPACIVSRLLLAVSSVMTVSEGTLGFSSRLEIYFREKQIEHAPGLNRGHASEQQLSKEPIFSKLHTVVPLNYLGAIEVLVCDCYMLKSVCLEDSKTTY